MPDAARFTRITDNLPLDRSPSAIRGRVEAMERLLERLLTIPGTRQKIGLDVMLDAVPVVGDLIGAALGLWIVWEARTLRMPKWQLARMMGNVGIDALLGAIPWVGAIPDAMFRSNSRNLKIIRRHLDRHHPETATIEVVARPSRS